MQGQHGAAGHGHVTQSDGHIRHHTIKRGAHTEETGLCLRRADLGLLRLHLGAGRFPLGLGAVERTLTDVLLLEELLLTIQLFAGHVQVGLRGFELGAAARHLLLGSAGVDAQQLLPSAHAVTGFDIQAHDGACHLGGQGGLAHRFDHGVQAHLGGTGRAGSGRHGFGAVCIGPHRAHVHSRKGQGRSQDQASFHRNISVKPLGGNSLLNFQICTIAYLHVHAMIQSFQACRQFKAKKL